MEDEDFLAAVEADNAAGVEEIEEEVIEQATAPEPKPQAEAQPAPTTTPEPVSQPVAEQQPEAKPEPQHAPISALLDERDKRKAAEAELQRYRAQEAQQQAPQAPDMFEDPEGYRAHQEQIVTAQALSTKLDISEELARDKFGDELVDQARDWALQKFTARPGFQQEVFGQRNPYRYVVEQFQRDQMASQVSPDDFAQFQAWKAAQTELQASQPQPAAPTPSPRAVPPRSLASAPSAGGVMTEVQQSEEEVFEEIFPRK